MSLLLKGFILQWSLLAGQNEQFSPLDSINALTYLQPLHLVYFLGLLLFVGKYFIIHPPFPSGKQWFYLLYTTFSFSCFWDPLCLSMWDIINHVWWHSPSENLCSATQITLTTASIYTKLRTKGAPWHSQKVVLHFFNLKLYFTSLKLNIQYGKSK